MQEHSVTIDGVIELPTTVDAKSFFDGLLDKIIEYVEAQHGFAGLGMSHQEYHEEVADEAADGGEAT